MKILRRFIGVILGLISLSLIIAMFSTLKELNISTILFYIIIIFIFAYFSYKCFYKSSNKYLTAKHKQELLANTSLTEGSLKEIENGIIPVVQTDKLILKPNEVCHYYTNATRLITKNRVIGYSGGSSGVNIRVAKGISLRTGSHRGTPIRGDVTEESHGQLFITSERIIFLSTKNNFETSLNGITALELYSNGIGIQDSKSYYTVRLISPVYPYAIIRTLAEGKQASL